jgi:hypothetical protein
MEAFRVADRAESMESSAIEQDVDELAGDVTPFHEDGLGPEPSDRAGRAFHVDDRPNLHLRQAFGLESVWRHHSRSRQEPVDQGIPEVVAFQTRSHCRDHHGIDDEREGPFRETRDHGPHNLLRVQHPRLGSADFEIPEHGAKLSADLPGRDRKD